MFSLRVISTLLVGCALVLGPGTRAGAQDPLAEVAAAVALGRDAEALRAIEALPRTELSSARVAYLRGRLFERGGRLGEAARAYADAGEGLPEPIVADARRRRAHLLARSGRCDAARPLLAELAAGTGSSAALARAVDAECALALGRLEGAISAYRAVVAEDAAPVDNFAARLGLADALERASRQPEAARELHLALVARPDHPDAATALERLRALGIEEPAFTTEEHRARATRLMNHRRYAQALAELDAAGRPADGSARAEWLHQRGMALYKTRHHYDEAARVLDQAYRASGRRAVDDAFHAARALSRADDDDRAIRAYRAIVRAHPNSRRAGQAEYLAAWLEIHHGRRAGEIHMRRFIDGPRGPRSPARRRSAIWHLGFRAFERGQHRRAAELFEQYASSGHGGLVRGRGLYWLGRAHHLAGRRADAISAYRRAIHVEALHWYACLAAERLVELGVDPGDPFPTPSTNGTGLAPLPPLALPSLSLFYASLGLRDDAIRALRSEEREFRERAPDGREIEALIRAYGSLGAAKRAYRLASQRRRDLSRRPGPDNRWVWEAAYPRPWRGAVLASARRQGITPAYVYATMRQESAYDPDAVSPAEAVGLLQLLPSNGERWARRLGVEADRSMLFDPVWNVRLGSAEIGSLYRRFGGAMPLSIAAYNAGVARVRRWQDEFGDIPMDHFVERIPFDETRNYVRRVMSHYARYRFLADPSVVFPVRGLIDAPPENQMNSGG